MNGLQIAGRRMSAALTTDLAARLVGHLDWADGQEDLTFLLWRRSSGTTRTTAIVAEPIWPTAGDR